MEIKILNLYAGIGGNRKLWTPNGDEHEITAVELNPKIAKVYQDFFPDDRVIVGDAHEYLLQHFKEYDFIWSSPPCQSHSKIRINSAVANGQNEPVFPDMKLYEEIIFLGGYFNGKWVVENVRAYYKPLIDAKESGRHYFWANFNISNVKTAGGEHDSNIETMMKRKGFDLGDKDCGHRKDQVLRNCVEPELGLHIFKCAFKYKQDDFKNIAKRIEATTRGSFTPGGAAESPLSAIK